MPLFNDAHMQTHTLSGTGYGFSGTRIEALEATEYTLVGIAADVSGSVGSYRDDIEACVQAVVRSCAHSPRAANLMLRLTTFDDRVHEVHGFRPLAMCDPAGYDGCIRIGGTTALYDGAVNCIAAVNRYGASLTGRALSCNAIVFVITDGKDNASSLAAADVARALGEATHSEAVESVTSILVGVDVSGDALSLYLNRLRKEAGFDRYIELADARDTTLARLAAFLSHSIAAQSRALGSGTAPPSLHF